MNTAAILRGDWVEQLRTLAAESVQCCVTSPPYWGLRDYGTAKWEGGSPDCDHVASERYYTEKTAAISSADAFSEPGEANAARVKAGRWRESGTCKKCGARRIDQQLGLEKTPQEYVEKIVAGFREVRRVLKNDGTLWLNLGDSYSGSGKGGNPEGSQWAGFVGNKQREKSAQASKSVVPNGLKPKDLIGIPWLVAEALKRPWFSGSIKNIEDRIWLAAMVDAEGCMFIHKRKEGQNNGQGYSRKNDSYGPGLEVANTSLAIVERCLAIARKGSICSQSPSQNNRRKQTIYRWNLRTVECRDLIRELYPHLVGKQHQARILCGCPSSGKQAELAHASLIALHRGYDSSIDFPPPPSCFESGYWLRSDIIWNKKNPMPESVTDRPTKAHEYLFLLSKSDRYYYDQDAIREPWTCDRDDMRENGVRTGLAYLQQTSTPHNSTPTSHRGGTFTNGKTRKPNVGEGERKDNPLGRNKRSVWTVSTSPYPEAHFATFPPDLIKPCILAGTAPGDTVLDPFFGSGTTGMVSLELGRKCIGIELNEKYIELAKQRCDVTPGLAL